MKHTETQLNILNHSEKWANMSSNIQISMFNQLLKLNSIGNREAAYMASTVLREFDPATDSAKSGTNAESMKDRLIQLMIILSIGGGLFLLIYFKPKRSVIIRKGKLLYLRALRKVEGPSEPFTENQISSAIPALNQFERDRGFVQKGIKVEDVSQQLELPPRLISYVINTTKKENFSSYINRLRLEYAAREINKSSKLKSFSVQDIAEQAGFTSRQTFTRLFHDFFGVTPTEYYERMKKDLG